MDDKIRLKIYRRKSLFVSIRNNLSFIEKYLSREGECLNTCVDSFLVAQYWGEIIGMYNNYDFDSEYKKSLIASYLKNKDSNIFRRWNEVFHIEEG